MNMKKLLILVFFMMICADAFAQRKPRVPYTDEYDDWSVSDKWYLKHEIYGNMTWKEIAYAVGFLKEKVAISPRAKLQAFLLRNDLNGVKLKGVSFDQLHVGDDGPVDPDSFLYDYSERVSSLGSEKFISFLKAFIARAKIDKGVVKHVIFGDGDILIADVKVPHGVMLNGPDFEVASYGTITFRLRHPDQDGKYIKVDSDNKAEFDHEAYVIEVFEETWRDVVGEEYADYVAYSVENPKTDLFDVDPVQQEQSMIKLEKRFLVIDGNRYCKIPFGQEIEDMELLSDKLIEKLLQEGFSYEVKEILFGEERSTGGMSYSLYEYWMDNLDKGDNANYLLLTGALFYNEGNLLERNTTERIRAAYKTVLGMDFGLSPESKIKELVNKYPSQVINVSQKFDLSVKSIYGKSEI